jgi:hypothetical protein
LISTIADRLLESEYRLPFRLGEFEKWRMTTASYRRILREAASASGHDGAAWKVDGLVAAEKRWRESQ